MSTVKRYRKKPVIIEAMQYDGSNEYEITLALEVALNPVAPEDRVDDPDCTAELWVQANGRWLPIEPGEWVARDSRGCYPVKPDIFEATYEAEETA